MKTLLISHADLNAIVAHVGIDAFMDELIQRLQSALAKFDPDITEIPVRDGFHYEAPVTGLIEWMPLLEHQRSVLMKVVGYHPNSPGTLQLPTILSTLSKYDPSSGHLVALVDGTFPTAMRTGAASAVASLAMAKPESSVVGLIGCGAQAVTQLHALCRVFDIRKVLISDIDKHALETFARRIDAFAPGHLSVQKATTDDIVSQSDILCVATSVEIGKGPVFQDQETKPWLHVNAVGSDFPGKIECPVALLERSYVCPDVQEQAIREGECQQLAASRIGDDLVSVVKNTPRHAELQARLSVFDSTGWALEDHVVMNQILEYAEDFNIGSEIEIESVTSDPRHPYEFLAPSNKHRKSGS